MIRVAKQEELSQLVDFAYRLNSLPQHKCKAFPGDYAGIMRQFSKMFENNDDQLLVAEEDGAIRGLLALLVEKDNTYLEAIGGVFTEDDYYMVASDFYSYIVSEYPGYRFDAAYPIENKQAISFMESIGAELIDYDLELRLKIENYTSEEHMNPVFQLSDSYYKGFVHLHDSTNPDVYWTGERLLKALDKFDVLITTKEEFVSGSVVTSKWNKDMAEIYLLSVTKDHKEKGIESALVGKAVEGAFKRGVREVLVMVERDNTLMLNLYRSMGFNQTDTCLTYSLKI